MPKFLLLLALGCGWGLTVAAAELPNLLYNGDMTEGEKTPTKWGYDGDKAKATFTRDLEQSYSAPASLKITLTEKGKITVGQKISRAVAGKKVRVGGTARREGLDNAQILLQCFDSNWKQLDGGWRVLATLPSGADWVDFAGETVVPEGSANVMFRLFIQGVGTVYLDDVSAVLPDELAPVEIPALPRKISGADKNLLYSGRWQEVRAGAPRAEWGATAVTLKFTGAAVNALIATDSGVCHLAARIDNQPATVLKLNPEVRRYALASGLADGEHTLQLIKRTESFCGWWQIDGFELAAGATLAAVPAPTRRLEVIGDSISAGYGNEAPDQNARFSPDTENADLTYGAIAARALGADYSCEAWSGKKMSPDNTLPELFDRAFPRDSHSTWDFTQKIPDAMVINLATNDFNGPIPEEERWTNDYVAFVKKLRGHYPTARIYLATGPMMTGEKLKILNGYLAKIREKLADANVAQLDLPTQTGKLGFGADWHPSVAQHRLGAQTLIDALKKDLGWEE